jgi:hypothetical protein
MQDLSPADNQSDLAQDLEQILRAADPDRLARQLGLRSAAAAEALRSNPAALKRLTANLLVHEDDGTLLDGARTLLLEKTDAEADIS